MGLKESLDRAESNAKIRDEQIEEEKKVNLEEINRMAQKADEQGYTLIKKNNKNQANFTQNITDNLLIIIQNNHLKQNEWEFLITIQPLLEYQINAIMNKENNSFMTITEIAKFVNKSRESVSRTVSSLLKKGILFEFVNVDEIKEFNRSVTSRTLFLNPELFYAGDKNKIDSTLATLVSRYDRLEKNKIKLKWKVWRKKGDTFGKLYHRKTYLEFKKNKI